MKQCIIVDLDSTLFNASHRHEHLENRDWDSFNEAHVDDVPNPGILKLINLLRTTQSAVDMNPTVVFMTGRSDKWVASTHDQLVKHVNFYPDNCELLMRQEGDFRSDFVIKKWYTDLLLNKGYQILLAIDDRDSNVEMWKAMGVEVCQYYQSRFNHGLQ